MSGKRQLVYRLFLVVYARDSAIKAIIELRYVPQLCVSVAVLFVSCVKAMCMVVKCVFWMAACTDTRTDRSASSDRWLATSYRGGKRPPIFPQTWTVSKIPNQHACQGNMQLLFTCVKRVCFVRTVNEHGRAVLDSAERLKL